MWTAGAMAAALLALTAAVTVVMRHAEPLLRALIVEKLEEQFHARVELDSFHVSVAQGLRAEGKGLRIWPPSNMAGQPAAGESASNTPLIQLADFRFRAPLHYSPGVPIHISKVELAGLIVDVPPRPHFAHESPGNGVEERNENEGHIQALPNPSRNAGGFGVARMESLAQFVVDGVDCRGAMLTLETSKPGKLPLQFAIARLQLTHVSANKPINFSAELTNPKPKGKINARGSFGPWVVDDPGESAVDGSYDFENADLGTIKGIGGKLNSTGTFKGALREMDVQGETDTPDFMLADFGMKMPLHTKFQARVDGTNGDTWLKPVEATLGQSHFWVEGQVVHEQASAGGAEGPAHPAGHEIALTVNVDRGRIEDFLKLASKTGNAMMTGSLKLKSQVEVPPGAEMVMEKLKLKGTFELDDAQFTSETIEKDISELSLRGEGKPKEASGAAKNGDAAVVQSAMAGDFEMSNATVSLPNLKYTVPGAEIDLTGKYGVEEGTLDFTGVAKLQATVSQMVGGWKGMLLKPADRFFKKDGAGTEVPIHIDGTRKDPHFGIDLDRMKKTEPERPGTQ